MDGTKLHIIEDVYQGCKTVKGQMPEALPFSHKRTGLVFIDQNRGESPILSSGLWTLGIGIQQKN